MPGWFWVNALEVKEFGGNYCCVSVLCTLMVTICNCSHLNDLKTKTKNSDPYCISRISSAQCGHCLPCQEGRVEGVLRAFWWLWNLLFDGAVLKGSPLRLGRIHFTALAALGIFDHLNPLGFVRILNWTSTLQPALKSQDVVFWDPESKQKELWGCLLGQPPALSRCGINRCN